MVSEPTTDIISLGAIWSWVRRGRTYVFVGMAMGLLAGVAAALLMPKTYRAEALVLPLRSDDPGALSGLAAQFGGLAAIAGVGGGVGDEREEVTAYLRSKNLLQRFIQDNDLLPVLFPDEWDAQGRKWRVPADEIPTPSRGVRYFQDNVFSLAQDRRAGTITVSVEWPDRVTASRWVNGIIDLANQELRARTIAQSQRTLSYLRTEATRTPILEVQASLYRLMESELKKISMASSRREFALRVIDPATTPDRTDFVSPNRPLLVVGLCIFGGIIGLLLSMIIFAVRGERRAATRAGVSGAVA